ncbi:unnamed protein product [Spirodela intermedia]|uniref:Reverse transcriptase domain-containing protein n=2 Tax=Spirodela intermedia TaxID=51605 RepID=A0A7I8KI40_SPIIN|nr:unnamed protein product [Spirodela intermedia]CAA6660980.1 unnamed protein product [Spirodela intermedia]CAA7397341.1 unnamed protein product [Spirodela intermedia]
MPDRFSIPIIEKLLDKLHGAKIFSKLDPEDVPKMAVCMHEGHYEFLVMPFGLSNAPATFKSLMNSIFASYLCRFVLIFFDDILVYSLSPKEHKEHLRRVLAVLHANAMHLNQKKCSFGKA